MSVEVMFGPDCLRAVWRAIPGVQYQFGKKGEAAPHLFLETNSSSF